MGINADIAYADGSKDYWANILREMQAGNWDQFSAIDRAPLVRPTGDGTIYSVLGGQLGGLNLTEIDQRRIKEAAAEYKEDFGGGDPLSDPQATQTILQQLQIASPGSTSGGLWGDPNALSRVTAGGNDIMSTVGYDPGIRTAGGDRFSHMDTWEQPAQYGFTLDHYGNVYKGGEQQRMDWLRQRDAMLPEDALGASEWNSSLSPMTDQEFQQAQYEKAQGRYTMANDLFDTYTERKANQNSNFFSSNLGKALAIGGGLLTGGIGALGAWAPAVGGAVTGGALGAPSGNILGGALTGGALAGLGAYGLEQVGGAEGLLGGLGDYVPSGISDLFKDSSGMVPFGDNTLQAFDAGFQPAIGNAGLTVDPNFLANPNLGGIAPGMSGLSATDGMLQGINTSFANSLLPTSSVFYDPRISQGGIMDTLKSAGLPIDDQLGSTPNPGDAYAGDLHHAGLNVTDQLGNEYAANIPAPFQTHANGYNLNLPVSAADQITPYFEGAGIGTPEPGVDYGELAKQGLKMMGGAEAPVQGGGVATSNTAPFRGGQFNPTAQQARFQGAQLNPLLRRF